MSFAERLREARTEKKYSQEYLAESVGVSRQTITKWESETGFPEMLKALKLASELQISLDWMFEDELIELGWNLNADEISSKKSLEGETMPQQKVNEAMVKDVVEKLYGPVIKGTMPTRIKCIDDIDGGLSRGSAYYVFGAPEIGKVPFAVNILVNYLRENRRVMYVLKERSIPFVLRQIVCTDANVSSYIRHEEYTADENNRIRESAEFIQQSNLIFDDSYDESIDKLFEKCINSKQQLDLVIIDSARLLYTVSDDKDEISRKKRIVSIIDKIARECRCAVLVLDRVSKDIGEMLKNHDDPEYIVSEFLKDSVLNDLDNMIFIHRDDYYRVCKNKSDFMDIVYKDGYHEKGCRYVKCSINKETGKITDLEDRPDTIIDIVAAYYNIDASLFRSKERIKELLKPKQVAMYICREKGYKLGDICRCLCRRDETTIIHGHNRISEEMKNNTSLADEIEDIMRGL